METISLNVMKHLTYMVLNKWKLEKHQAPIPLHSDFIKFPPPVFFKVSWVLVPMVGITPSSPFHFLTKLQWGWLAYHCHIIINWRCFLFSFLYLKSWLFGYSSHIVTMSKGDMLWDFVFLVVVFHSFKFEDPYISHFSLCPKRKHEWFLLYLKPIYDPKQFRPKFESMKYERLTISYTIINYNFVHVELIQERHCTILLLR